MTKRTIKDFEIINHGVEHSQYFQGCGVSHTSYTDVATGIGDTPSEALNDALEQLAANGWDVEPIDSELELCPAQRLEWLGEEYDAHEDCAPENCPDETGECDHTECAPEGWHDGCELHWFVSVRVKGEADGK